MIDWDDKPAPPKEYGILDEIKFVLLGFCLVTGLSLLLLLIMVAVLGGLR